MKKHWVELALVAFVMATPAQAAQIIAKDAWFRALPAGLPAGGYFTLHNAGANSVALSGADSPACAMLMLHKSETESGASRMTDVSSVAIPGAGDVSFAPGGYHLMCMHPTAAMKPGANVPVNLDFSDGTKMTVTFAVKNARGQ